VESREMPAAIAVDGEGFVITGGAGSKNGCEGNLGAERGELVTARTREIAERVNWRHYFPSDDDRRRLRDQT